MPLDFGFETSSQYLETTPKGFSSIIFSMYEMVEIRTTERIVRNSKKKNVSYAILV